MKFWHSLLKSLRNLWTLFVDNVAAVGAFAIIGFAALVVHKSVEKLQLWGVPSNLIAGMEILDTCIWLIDALAVLWLGGVAAIRFCTKVLGEQR